MSAKSPHEQRLIVNEYASELTSCNDHLAVARLGWVLNQLAKDADETELAELHRIESLALLDIKTAARPVVSREFEKGLVDRGLLAPDCVPADL